MPPPLIYSSEAYAPYTPRLHMPLHDSPIVLFLVDVLFKQDNAVFGWIIIVMFKIKLQCQIFCLWC